MLTPGPEPQRRTITAEQAEAEYFNDYAESINRERNPLRLQQLRKPMGFNNEKWEEMKSQMVAGDELWEYTTAKIYWEQMMGSSGIELIRNGEIVCSMRRRVS